MFWSDYAKWMGYDDDTSEEKLKQDFVDSIIECETNKTSRNIPVHEKDRYKMFYRHEKSRGVKMSEEEKEEIIHRVRQKNGVGRMVGFSGDDEKKMNVLFDKYGSTNKHETFY